MLVICCSYWIQVWQWWDSPSAYPPARDPQQVPQDPAPAPAGYGTCR